MPPLVCGSSNSGGSPPADGHGPNYIRRKLEDEQIPCPTWWNRQKGLRNIYSKFEKLDPENGRFVWDFTTIQDILANPVYIGTIASQKSEYKFKVGWIGAKAPEDWITVEDMHEPIIDRETFELVQSKVKSRKRPDAWGNYGIFAGLVKCGQCGSSMSSATDSLSEREVIERSISVDNERIRELERVIGRLYEDMVSGRLNEDTFNSILEQKQSEQTMLRNRVRLYSERLSERQQEELENERWLEMIKEYAGIRELDAPTLNRLINVIVIHEDFDGESVRQTVEINWNFKGTGRFSDRG